MNQFTIGPHPTIERQIADQDFIFGQAIVPLTCLVNLRDPGKVMTTQPVNIYA
ncbi:hypothetical protein GCM10027577_39460 [Spirosoma fluminis]